MLRRVALVRTDISEERSTSIIRMARIGELGTSLPVTINRSTLRAPVDSYWLLITANVIPTSPILVTLMMEELRSSETSFLTRPIRRNIPEYGILYMRFVYYRS
jgi:hypothetical protein